MQQLLFDNIDIKTKFPSTRYQGSKSKFLDWIWYYIKDIEFDSVLDAFGGTGSVSYLLKQNSKSVTYNDILNFNSIIGSALIENKNTYLSDEDVNIILNKDSSIIYPNFIEKTFDDIYYTQEENNWLDIVSTNIRNIENEYKRNIAWFALFQSCIIKRPYNLFHRKNLYIRTNEIKRSFGNKTTWDTPFKKHFSSFVNEANSAIFDNHKDNYSINKNVFDIKNIYDLIYIDTPYISNKGIGVDYYDFYHFLEGMCDYQNWENKIDYNSKHKRLLKTHNDWNNPNTIYSSFEKLISHFKNSIIVISYRSNGIPSIEDIKKIMIQNGKKVTIHESNKIKYVLSNNYSNEVLIIGE